MNKKLLSGYLFMLIALCLSCKPDVKQEKTVENKLRFKQIKMKDLLGINAFEWDFLQDPHNPNDGSKVYDPKMNLLKSFSEIRHYMDWEKIEDKEGDYTFNPTRRGGWNYDAIYERCKLEGITVLGCLKNTPDWLYKTYPVKLQDVDIIPVKYKASRLDPRSYIAQARAIFQYGARYGSNKKIDTSLVKVNKTRVNHWESLNTVKIGLDLVKYVECNNEPDKWWKGSKSQQTGSEYAANLSAFYDGDKGKLGKGAGVKNADPNMKVVIGGLGRPDIKFVQDIVEWCKKNRGYKPDGSVDLCFDVINFHLYSNDNTGWFAKFKSNKRGVAPEINNEMGKFADIFVNYALTLGKDVEVWTTETGYDLKQQSIQRAIPIGGKSVLITQADWTLRTSLMYARHGLSRVFFYQAFDTEAPGTPYNSPFGSAGLLNAESRRPAADYLLQVNKLMGEYVYDGTANQDPFVDIYKLNNKIMYVLVVPDEKDRHEDYELDLHKAKKARIHFLKAGSDVMTEKDVNTDNGMLKVSVTETPVFVEAL